MIHKDFLRLNRKIINIKCSKLYSENNERWWNAAASAQAAQGCHDILYIQKHKRTDDSLEEALGTTNGLQEKEAHICKNWLQVWNTGFNLCILYK
jgi:hypothetical protein